MIVLRNEVCPFSMPNESHSPCLEQKEIVSEIKHVEVIPTLSGILSKVMKAKVAFCGRPQTSRLLHYGIILRAVTAVFPLPLSLLSWFSLSLSSFPSLCVSVCLSLILLLSLPRQCS